MLNWAHATAGEDGGEKSESQSVVALKCPSWIYEADIPFRKVTFSENCEAAIENAIASRRKKKGPKSYVAANNLTETKLLISQVCMHRV